MPGIVNVSKVLDVVVSLQNTAAKVLSDGKVNVADLPLVMEVYAALSAVPGIDLAEALVEVQDVDPSEAKELAEAYKAALKIPANVAVEDVLKHGADVVVIAVETLEKVQALVVDCLALAEEIKALVKPAV